MLSWEGWPLPLSIWGLGPPRLCRGALSEGPAPGVSRPPTTLCWWGWWVRGVGGRLLLPLAVLGPRGHFCVFELKGKCKKRGDGLKMENDPQEVGGALPLGPAMGVAAPARAVHTSDPSDTAELEGPGRDLGERAKVGIPVAEPQVLKAQDTPSCRGRPPWA